VTSIGESAFEGCAGLKTVTIPNGVTSIESNVFKYCSKLETVTIEGDVTSISGSAFYNCTSLTSITMSGDLKTIGESAFYNCTKLETVTVMGKHTDADGVIQGYFKKGTDWKLPGMSPDSDTSIKYLFLPDISSADYNPNDGDGGIAGAYGRGLYYGNTNFTWNYYVSLWETDGFEVSLTSETGISGFEYSIVRGGSSSVYTGEYTDPLIIGNGYKLTVTALLATGYEFKEWSGYSDSEENLLVAESVTGAVSLTASASKIKYSVSGTLKVTGGASDSKGKIVTLTSTSDSKVYTAVTESGGTYEIENVPYGTAGNITATITGYSQTESPETIDSLAGPLTGQNITLMALYTVTLTAGTGISGFEYSINGEDTVDYEEPFQTEHGDTLSVTALLTEGYEFKEWTGSDSDDSQLEIESVTGAVSVTASGELIRYGVTFDSGSYYAVYTKDGSLSSSVINVTYGSSLLFGIRVSEGYSVYPVVSGNANIILQTDGWYRISDIRSDILVGIAVNTVYGDGGGTGNGSGDSPYGNGNSSGTDTRGSGSGVNSSGSGNAGNSTGSENNIPYWIPIAIAAAIIACAVVALTGQILIKRRKEDGEEDGN
jgi:hypothetical protein